MTKKEFANFLGFQTYDDLLGASKYVYQEGDISWYVTKTEKGYAAWDDAELAADRVEFFDKEDAAREYLASAWEVC